MALQQKAELCSFSKPAGECALRARILTDSCSPSSNQPGSRDKEQRAVFFRQALFATVAALQHSIDQQLGFRAIAKHAHQSRSCTFSVRAFYW